MKLKISLVLACILLASVSFACWPTIAASKKKTTCGAEEGIGSTFYEIRKIYVYMGEMQQGGVKGWFPEVFQPDHLQPIIERVVRGNLERCVTSGWLGDKHAIEFIRYKKQIPKKFDDNALFIFISSQYSAHPNHEEKYGAPNYALLNVGYFRKNEPEIQFGNLRLMKQRVFFLNKDAAETEKEVELFLNSTLVSLKAWPQPGSIVRWKD